MIDEITLAIDGDRLFVFLLVTILAFVHLLPDEIHAPVEIPRHVLLSVAGGVSIVYAFLHLFPDLDARREALSDVDVLFVSLSEYHIYAVVFVGLSVFYGLERLASVRSASSTPATGWRPVSSLLGNFRGRPRTVRIDEPYDEPVFWVHVGGFAVYNAFIGYALVHGEIGTENTSLFAFAMALHLLANDAALEQHHHASYKRIGRWLLVGAVFCGGAVGAVYTFDAVSHTVLLGLLTGGLVFNAIKDELPQTRESRFWAFAVGSVGYAAILSVL